MQEELNRTAPVDVASFAVGSVPPMLPGGCGAENQIIAGYTLESRLGAGSYGEVWRAIGPGGLPKAVKILYGRHDGPQAETELRSLQKLRDVRHPFILSIERIEVIGDRLVIVTELAERSLEAYFEEARQHGRGIPREDLLAFLRDAADALDFMAEEHGLQHLDVKPGNLLVQGHHVKVADFGLIKELKGNDASLVSGFTPLYAAPEVFEGRPSPRSDQYSLAMVYHVMLCGVPPFSGRNAAQLMSQHLSSKPDLSALPPSDRPAVSRALSKNPNVRFPDCRSFVQALEKPRNSGAASRPRAPQRQPAAAVADTTSAAADPHDTAVVPWREARPLPPLVLRSQERNGAPVLVVGVGGLAGRILTTLRGRMSDCFGAGRDLPSLPLLYLDSDPQALDAACEGRPGRALRPEETLHLPLRDAGAYRSGPTKAGEWLSRRWLFNIPRSRKVEGMRPLGRLVLVDHVRMIRRQITELLRRALRPESIEATAAASGLPLLGATPEVYVVASTCGGTGSGSVLDLGYLVRSVLQELQLDQASITGVLLHATGARADLAEVQRANTLCCLAEFDRFVRGAGYPGDPACGLRATAEPPFDHTRLFHFGDGCTEAQYDLHTRNIGEYLFRTAATPAREFVEQQRRQQAEGERLYDAAGTIGLLGVGVLGGVAGAATTVDSDALCLAVVARWLRKPESAAGDPSLADQTPQQTAALFEKLRLTRDMLTAKAMHVLEGNDIKRIESFFRANLPSILGGAPAGERHAESVLRAIGQHFLDESLAGTASDHPTAVLRGLQDELAKTACVAADALARHFLKVADTAERHVTAAQEALADAMNRLADLSACLQDFARGVEGDAQRLAAELATAARGGAANPLDRYLTYARLCFCKSVFQLLAEFVVDLRKQAKEINGILLCIRMRLEELESRMARDGGGKRLPDHQTVEAFDLSLRRGGWVRFAALIEEDSLAAFHEKLREAATEYILAAASSPGAASTSDSAIAYVERCEEQALPGVGGVAGYRRVLAVLPAGVSEESWRRRLTERFGNCVSLQTGTSDRVVVVCDVEGVQVEDIAATLATSEHLREIARRLHTRTDVDWN